MNTKKLFLLNWRKVWIVIVADFACIVLHNLVSAWLGFEEGVFFILAIFVIPIYFIVVVIYSIVYLIKKKAGKKDEAVSEVDNSEVDNKEEK